MPTYTEHEFLHLQEHIRGTAASAQACRQFALLTTDPDLKAFCKEEANICQSNAQKLMSMLNQGQAH